MRLFILIKEICQVGSMLQDIRDNSQGTVAKVIVGLIVLTFALFGVDSIVGGFGGEPEVAVVNGTDIKESEFLRAVDIKKRQILNQMGQNADPALIDDRLLKQSVLAGLIDQEILLQDAVDHGIYISDQSIDGLITGINQFHVDGSFDNDLFLASIRNFGMTTQSFKESIKTEVLISQPRNAIVSSSFLLNDEFSRIVEIDRQTRSYSLVKFEQSAYIDTVNITEVEIQQYYDDNPDQFRTLEAIDVEYIELNKNSLLDSVSVDEEVLRALYEDEIAEFISGEERNASHILIEINDEVTEEQAKAKADEINTLLVTGGDFEELAKKHSDDMGSAKQGGSLGFAAKGAYLPEFEDALFALTEGGVSAPVQTEYGFHIIKLIEIQTQPIPEFDEMKYSLEADAKIEKAEALYVELAQKLADVSYASADLIEPSEELNLKVITQEGVSASAQGELFSNQKVQAALFSLDVLKEGNNSDLIEISAEKSIVLRAAKHHPAAQKNLDVVRDEINTLLLAQKASEKAKELGEALAAELKQKDTSQVSSITWEKFTDIKRNDASQEAELLKAIFSMSKPQDGVDDNSVTGIVMDGDYVLIKLDAVNAISASDVKDEERKAIVRVIGGGLGNAEYQLYQEALKASASIEKI